MNLYLDSRTGNERRNRDLALPPGGEFRINPERRNPRMTADRLADYNRVLSDGYWGAAEDESSTE